jgi:hypothetical protein
MKPESQSRRKYLTAACENLKNSAERAQIMLAGNVEELTGWAMSLLETCEELEEENLLLRGEINNLSKAKND